jgi:hypothetical protein
VSRFLRRGETLDSSGSGTVLDTGRWAFVNVMQTLETAGGLWWVCCNYVELQRYRSSRS